MDRKCIGNNFSTSFIPLVAIDFVQLTPLQNVVQKPTVQIISNVMYVMGGFRAENVVEKYNIETQQSLGNTQVMKAKHLEAASCVNPFTYRGVNFYSLKNKNFNTFKFELLLLFNTSVRWIRE